MKIILAYYLGRKSENADADLFDRLICWATQSRYSHIELIPTYNEYVLNNRSWSSSPKDDGVRCAYIDFRTGHWELYEVEVDVTAEHIESWFTAHVGAKYDWLGAVGAEFSFVKGSRKRMFCSEAIGTCLGIPSASTLTPQELFDQFRIMGHRKIALPRPWM